MKKDYSAFDVIMYFVLGVIFWTVIIMHLTSCQSPQRLLEKFHKRGGKIECKSDTVQIEKIVKDIHGKDSTIYITIKEYYPEIVTKTRWQVRFDNKRFNDSLKNVRLMYSDSIKSALKQAKNAQRNDTKQVKTKAKHETKQTRAKSRWILWLIVGFVVAHLLRWAWILFGAFRNFPKGRL
jgi:hypothetical protein